MYIIHISTIFEMMYNSLKHISLQHCCIHLSFFRYYVLSSVISSMGEDKDTVLLSKVHR